MTVVCGLDARLTTRAVAELTAARAPAERWAVLRNGIVWPTAAQPGCPQLACYDAGAACGCCVGQVALRVTLARLLRDASRAGAAWDALIAELGAGVHPQTVVELLHAPAFAGHFVVTRRIVVLDAAAAVRLLAGPAASPARLRLAMQLSFADELLLELGPARVEAAAALRAAATPGCRVSWLQATGAASDDVRARESD